jgi:hypothetical protein
MKLSEVRSGSRRQDGRCGLIAVLLWGLRNWLIAGLLKGETRLRNACPLNGETLVKEVAFDVGPGLQRHP